MKPYDVHFSVVGNLQEMRNEHLDIMEQSGFSIIDGPFLERNHKGSIHRYVVRNNKKK